MTGWHYIAVDIRQYENGLGWVKGWVLELTQWPARMDEWTRAQGVVAPDDVELPSDPGA